MNLIFDIGWHWKMNKDEMFGLTAAEVLLYLHQTHRILTRT